MLHDHGFDASKCPDVLEVCGSLQAYAEPLEGSLPFWAENPIANIRRTMGVAKIPSSIDKSEKIAHHCDARLAWQMHHEQLFCT